MEPKKIIVPIILFLLLAGILLITRGIHPQSTPDPSSAPSVLTGAASSATAVTTAQQTEEPSNTPEQTGASFAPIHYITDNSKPVKAKKNDTLKFAGKKAVFEFDSDNHDSLYIIQKDGTVDEYPHGTDDITNLYQAKNWLYYTREDSDTFATTLYRAPIRQQEKKTAVWLKKEEQLKKLDIYQFVYGTDQYVICTIENNLIKYNVKSKKCERIDPAPDEALDITWYPVCDEKQQPIVSKHGDLYITKHINAIDDDSISGITFYKINTDTFRKTKLSDRTNAVLSDSSGQIVIMESDEKWNYAYYPETGKRTRCGQNMMAEWGTDDTANDFDEEDAGDMLSLPSAANRDLVGWIRKKNPWSYQEKNGHFSCVNYFVYNDRMYVKVNFDWEDPEETAKDGEEGEGYNGEFAKMLFSYSLKNYQGIRPETELNRIMQKYSSRTYEWIEDTSYYYYTETGNFSFLFKDILVFDYNDFYVLYHLGTGAYRKIEEKNKDALYLKGLHEK